MDTSEFELMIFLCVSLKGFEGESEWIWI